MTLLSLSSTIIVLSFMLLVALVLLILGVRGKRVGDAPHCRKCGYDLTGTPSGNCPECGSFLAPYSIVIGERRLRARLLIIGLLLAVISGGTLGVAGYGHARNVNWYAYYPAFVLVGMAEGDDVNAINELLSRLQNDTLPRAKAGDLIAIGLAMHGATPASANVVKWADLLGYMDGNGWMSEEQQDRFYRQLAPPTMMLRPRMRPDDWLVFAIQVEDRGTSLLPGTFKMRVDNYMVDGDSVGYRQGRYWNDISLGWGQRTTSTSFRYRVAPRPVGANRAKCTVTQAIFDPRVDPETSDPIWSHQWTFEGLVEVVPYDAPDPIALIEDDSLEDVLQGAIKINDVTRRPRADGRPDDISAALSLRQPVPLCLAFDVIALMGTDEIELGTVTWSKGGRGDAYLYPARRYPHEKVADFEIPSEVTIELRASREVASESVDCFDVWAGTLRFGPVKLTTQR